MLAHFNVAASTLRLPTVNRTSRTQQVRLLLVSGIACLIVLFWSAQSRTWDNSRESVTQAPVTDREPIRCLIVTGEDYAGHKWQETAPVLKEFLEKGGKIKADIASDLSVLRSEKPFSYQVLILHFKNYDPEMPGKAGLETLQRFVQDGGGLILVHFACGAFQEFKDDFVQIAGRVWDPQLRAHDPHGEFVVRIVDRQHPITQGLSDFSTVDELYTCLTGNVDIHVLAVARSKVDGLDYPMAFVLQYGKGRVFHCVLGHDTRAFEAAEVQELYRRACLWCANQLGQNTPDSSAGRPLQP